MPTNRGAMASNGQRVPIRFTERFDESHRSPSRAQHHYSWVPCLSRRISSVNRETSCIHLDLHESNSHLGPILRICPCKHVPSRTQCNCSPRPETKLEVLHSTSNHVQFRSVPTYSLEENLFTLPPVLVLAPKFQFEEPNTTIVRKIPIN